MYPVLELVDVRLSHHINNSRFSTTTTDLPSPDTASGGTDGRPLLSAPDADADAGDGDGDHDGGKGSCGSGNYGALPSPPPSHEKGERGGSGSSSSSSSSSSSRIRSWLLPGPTHYGRRRPLVYLGARLGVVLLASLLAFLLPEFELVVAFVGSLGASALAFVVPGLLAWRCYPRAARRQKAQFLGLVVFGVVGGGVGASYALRAMVGGESHC